jgi:hypothetical protein
MEKVYEQTAREEFHEQAYKEYTLQILIANIEATRA